MRSRTVAGKSVEPSAIAAIRSDRRSRETSLGCSSWLANRSSHKTTSGVSSGRLQVSFLARRTRRENATKSESVSNSNHRYVSLEGDGSSDRGRERCHRNQYFDYRNGRRDGLHFLRRGTPWRLLAAEMREKSSRWSEVFILSRILGVNTQVLQP